MIGGIAANNASGMCCGTAQNSYHTLAGMRVVLADGSVLDTRDAASRAAFAHAAPESLAAWPNSAAARAPTRRWPQRIRHKFRLKNTTGYSLNALVDFDDPVDMLAHLMIGSEGTLGFISEISYLTVEEHAHKASALILFDHRDRLQRRKPAQAHAGGRGRTARPRVAALGAGQAGHAGGAARAAGRRRGAAGGDRAPRPPPRCR